MNLLAPIGFPESSSIATLRCWSVWEVLDDDDSVVRLVVGWIKPTRLRITSPIDQFEDYNEVRPHSSIGRMPPRCFARLQRQQAVEEGSASTAALAIPLTPRAPSQ